MNHITVMKQALDALERLRRMCNPEMSHQETLMARIADNQITALRAAIEQGEPITGTCERTTCICTDKLLSKLRECDHWRSPETEQTGCER